MSTVVRLTKFHELNVRPSLRHCTPPTSDEIQTFRVFFRCLFVVPLFILACDGLRPHQHVNENMLVFRSLPPVLLPET